MGGTYTDLATGVISSSYVVYGLTSGIVYEFRVYARNQFGYSLPSSELQLLAGYKPEQPSAPETVNSGAFIDVMWTEPFSNGSPI
jgi:hypothetical protein